MQIGGAGAPSQLFPRIRGFLDRTQPVRGLLEDRRVKGFPFLSGHSSALLGAGMGLLNGGRNAWANAFQGLSQGAQMDTARQERQRQEEERADYQSAVEGFIPQLPDYAQPMAQYLSPDQLVGLAAPQSATTDREIRNDQNGVPRYTDTKEPVFPDVQPQQQPEEIDPAEVRAIRSDFDGLTSDFRDVEPAYRRIQSVDESAAGDLALIFNYMKMLDPGSVVRESEFATAQNAAGVPERVRNLWNNLLTGERLGDAQRADFKSQSANLYGAARQQYDLIAAQYTALAQEIGIDPNLVVLPWPEIGAEGGGGGYANPDATQPAGPVYIWQGPGQPLVPQ